MMMTNTLSLSHGRSSSPTTRSTSLLLKSDPRMARSINRTVAATNNTLVSGFNLLVRKRNVVEIAPITPSPEAEMGLTASLPEAEIGVPTSLHDAFNEAFLPAFHDASFGGPSALSKDQIIFSESESDVETVIDDAPR